MFRLRLRRQIGVPAAGKVSVCPVAAPECITIRTPLIFAVAGALNAVSVGEIFQKVSVKQPGTHGAGGITELLAKEPYEFIRQFFALLRRISDGEAHIGVPVPGITSAPLYAAGFHQRLNDFKPDSDFVSGGSLFQQSDIEVILQCVILQKPGGRQIVLPGKFHLPCHGFMQIHRESRFNPANEIDDIDDFVFHVF